MDNYGVPLRGTNLNYIREADTLIINYQLSILHYQLPIISVDFFRETCYNK